MLGRLRSALSPIVAARPDPEQTPAAVEPAAAMSAAQTAPAPGGGSSGLPDFVVPRGGLPLERTYCQLGFTAVPDVFQAEDIAAFRRAAIDLFPDNKPPYQARYSDTALFTKAFRRIFVNHRLIGSLKRLFGDDFVFINEFAVHDSGFAGWHADTSSPDGKVGHDFHWSPGFMVTNVAIYLADNLNNGSGLDLVPRSYVLDDPTAKAIRRDKGFGVGDFMMPDEAYPYDDAVTLRTKAGDVAMFNLRTRHRASVQPVAARDDAERKLALFLIVGPNNAQSRRYRAWLDEYATIHGGDRPQVPVEFRTFLTAQGLSII